jgi:hypothetical protein
VKTIAKFSLFVIFIAAVALFFFACGHLTPGAKQDAVSLTFDPPQVTGHIENLDITEASGLAVSKCQANVLWTHNDSGDGPFIYAVGPAGQNLGTWKVANAQNIDWEDIAERKEADGTCRLYIGDIGDNGRKREVHTVYRVREPTVTDSNKNTREKNAVETEPAESVNFSYTDKKENAETLMVHPVTGDIYVLTKSHKAPSDVYKVKPSFGSNEMQKVAPIANLEVPSIPVGLLTGGDISNDGRRVAICDYLNGYELTLPAGDTNFDDIWKQQTVVINLGPRDQGESIAYSTDDNMLFATSEGKNPPIIEVKRK